MPSSTKNPWCSTHSLTQNLKITQNFQNTSRCREVGFGIWLKHPGEIRKLTRLSFRSVLFAVEYFAFGWIFKTQFLFVFGWVSQAEYYIYSRSGIFSNRKPMVIFSNIIHILLSIDTSDEPTSCWRCQSLCQTSESNSIRKGNVNFKLKLSLFWCDFAIFNKIREKNHPVNYMAETTNRMTFKQFS